MPKKIKNVDKVILELLYQKKTLTSSELAILFNYSVPVVRNICQNIAKKHGLSYKRGILKHSHSEKFTNMEKLLIARKSCSFINDGDTIFIGTGTTTLYMCQHLYQFTRLTVVTNSIPILTELLKYPQITTICVGGVLQHQDQALVGEFSDIFIKNFYINKLFLGTEGIDAIRGASRAIIQKNMAEHNITNLASEIYLLTDSSKFGKLFTWIWLSIEQISTIITDSNISKEQVLEFKNSNIDLVIVDKQY